MKKMYYPALLALLFLMVCIEIIPVNANETKSKVILKKDRIIFLNREGHINKIIRLGVTQKVLPASKDRIRLERYMSNQITPEKFNDIITTSTVISSTYTDYKGSFNNDCFLIKVEKYKRLQGKNISSEFTLDPYETSTVIQLLDETGSVLWEKSFLYAANILLSNDGKIAIIFSFNGKQTVFQAIDKYGFLKAYNRYDEILDYRLSDDGNICIVRAFDYVKQSEYVSCINILTKKIWIYQYNFSRDGIVNVTINPNRIIFRHSKTNKQIVYTLNGKEVK